MSADNVQLQHKKFKVTIEANGDKIEVEFTYTREDVSSMTHDLNTISEEKTSPTVNRKWFLHGIKDPAIKQKIIDIINADGNFTFDMLVMGKLFPLLQKNQATLIGLETVN